MARASEIEFLEIKKASLYASSFSVKIESKGVHAIRHPRRQPGVTQTKDYYYYLILLT